jgi:hypothetical protein
MSAPRGNVVLYPREPWELHVENVLAALVCMVRNSSSLRTDRDGDKC